MVEGAELIRADLGAAGVAAEAVEGMDAVCHQAARVGLGVDFADAPAYVSDNQLATARLLAALAAAASPDGWCWPARWWSTAKAATAARRTEWSGPSPDRPPIWKRAASIRSCPRLRGARFRGPRSRSRPLSTPARCTPSSKVGQEHLCASWARQAGSRTGASVVALRYHNVYGPRLPFGTPYAGRGRAVVQRPAARRGAPGVRGRPADPRTSCT